MSFRNYQEEREEQAEAEDSLDPKTAARLKRRYVECPYKQWDEDEKIIGFI